MKIDQQESPKVFELLQASKEVALMLADILRAKGIPVTKSPALRRLVEAINNVEDYERPKS